MTDTATALLRLYQAVRTAAGCLSCDGYHVGAGALVHPFECSCPCHAAAGALRAMRMLDDRTPRRRVGDPAQEVS